MSIYYSFHGIAAFELQPSHHCFDTKTEPEYIELI